MQELGLACRHCGETHKSKSVELIVAWYFIHAVRNHWEYVQELHSMSDETIMDVFDHGKRKGLFPT